MTPLGTAPKVESMGDTHKKAFTAGPELRTTKATLTRGLDLATILVPQTMTLDESRQRLRWRWDYDDQASVRALEFDDQMFDDFLALDGGEAATILAYARRYGPLDICEHHEPRSHNHENIYPLLWGIDKGQFLSHIADEGCQPLYDGDAPEWLWEPIERWQYYAREAVALIGVAERTLRGREAHAADWAVLAGPYSFWPPPSDFAQRMMVASRVGSWLTMGNIQPRFRWFKEGARLDWQAGGLFGALAMQLASVIAQTGGFAYCDGCGKRIEPNHLLKPGKRVFCDDCRKHGVPQALAAQDYRARKKAQGGTAKKSKEGRKRGRT